MRIILLAAILSFAQARLQQMKIRTGRSAFDDIEANEDGTYAIGDMRLGPAQMRMHFGIGSDDSLNSGVMANLRWPGGVIPYEFSNKRGLSLSSRNKQRVRDGIRKFNQEMSGALRSGKKNPQIRILFLCKMIKPDVRPGLEENQGLNIRVNHSICRTMVALMVTVL